MSVATTTSTYASLRDKLLAFVPEGGGAPDTLQQRLTGGLWILQPKDTVSYPYGVMRLQDRETDGDYNGDRETLALELQLFGRNRAQQMAIEAMADTADEALLRFKDVTGGLMFSRSRQRDSIPAGSNPTDHEVVAVRMLYPLVAWPGFLTKYAD
jgi:hypothetical protein